MGSLDPAACWPAEHSKETHSKAEPRSTHLRHQVQCLGVVADNHDAVAGAGAQQLQHARQHSKLAGQQLPACIEGKRGTKA